MRAFRAQLRTELALSLRNGEQLLVNLFIPLGLLVNRQIMLFIGDEAGTAADLTADPSLLWIAALCAVVALVTAIAAFVPARTGGRVSVTEALRYE